MTNATDLELENLSDEEREALEGEDIGSEADAERAAKAAEAIADDDAAGAPAGAAAAADEEIDAGEPIGTRLAAPTIDGHQEAMAKLLDDRKALRERYREGDISAEEKDKLEDEINDQITDLRSDQKLAAFTEANNQQMAEQEYVRTIAKVKADVLQKDGIDYDANPMLLQNWDLKVRALASDPKNADKPGDWYLREAHKQVLAEAAALAESLGYQRGDKTRSSGDPVRDALIRRRPADTRAKSLSTLPAAAADSGLNGSEFSHLDRMSGDDLEAAVARMTPEQQDRWAQQ